MAKIKNVSGEDKHLPWLGDRLVLAGGVVEVPDDTVYNYTLQKDNWAPADAAAKSLHAKGHKAEYPNDEAQEAPPSE